MDVKCPRCGNKTILRTRSKDGSKFHVCVNYPRCKGRVLVSPTIKSITEPTTAHSQSSARAYEGPPMVEAIKHAQERGVQIAAKYKLTPDSASRLAQIVSDGIKKKRGIDGLARDIRKEFPDMTTEQARLIAQSETGEALSHANLERSKAMGVTGKEWVCAPEGAVPPVCDICRANEAEGPIPVDQMFSGGVMGYPQHEGCRCCLAPVMLPEKKQRK
jgi:ssDNA-binding Zn-finger/Zn-ribbon topoisomerase 1